MPARAGEQYDGGIALFAEAPGAREEATGRPMVGRTGDLADRLLWEAGLSRALVVVLNRLRCRPPNNDAARYPEAFEACDDWLAQELEIYNPAVVVVMGGKAMGELFGANAKVGETRGTWRTTGPEHKYGSRSWIATYHPAASFRPGKQQEIRNFITQDLKEAKRTWDLLKRSA